MNQKGFTLIELLTVILLLSILSLVAFPIFTDYSTQARVAVTNATVSSVRVAVALFRANPVNTGFPTALDTAAAAACTTANPCFGNVLAPAITEQWTKTAANTYTAPDGRSFTYTPATGAFV